MLSSSSAAQGAGIELDEVEVSDRLQVRFEVLLERIPAPDRKTVIGALALLNQALVNDSTEVELDARA